MSRKPRINDRIQRSMMEPYRLHQLFMTADRRFDAIPAGRKAAGKSGRAVIDLGRDELEPRDDETSCVPKKRAKKPIAKKPDACAAIVAAAMLEATTPEMRELLAGTRSLAVVIKVPSSSWVKPVERHFTEVLSEDWWTFARDGSNRMRDKNTVGNDEVGQRLSSGARVVGIASNPEVYLPTTLVTAADVTITIANPTGAVVLDAMRRSLSGRSPKRIANEIVAGLELADLVAAMRAGSPSAKAHRRLKSGFERRRGTVAKVDPPRLDDAVEYGAARDWGLSLARDIADYRTGRLAWRDVDRGAVFYSEPGCGKSLLAASIAQACKIPLIRASMSEFFSDNAGDLGAVIKSQRATFARAASIAPVLLFIDEVDAVPNRATLSPRGADWWLPVITDLLLLLDSAMSARDGIVVCAATNRIEAVDTALLRPGRLERAIRIVRPGLAGIVNILRYQLGSSLKAFNLDEVARLAEGSTPAEIMEMVRAARRSARQAHREMSLEDLKAQALPPENYSAPTLRLLSLHEAAHAVAAIKLNVGKVVAIRLQSRGHVGGYTKVRDDTDELAGLDHIENRVVGILSARSAERLFLGYASTGSGGTPASDLGVATAILAGLHTSAGYGSTLLYRCNMDEATDLMRLDPRLQREVELHLRKLESRADAFVRGHRVEIFAVADALAAARHLSGGQVEEILECAAAGDLPYDFAVRRPANDDAKGSRKPRRA